MKAAFAVLVALLITGPYAWAQTAPPGPDQSGRPAQAAPSDTGQPHAKVVQGKIKSLEQSSVTLEDGTTLVFPESIKVVPDSLKEGATIKATYEEQGGQKVVISIEVQPAEAE